MFGYHGPICLNLCKLRTKRVVNNYFTVSDDLKDEVNIGGYYWFTGVFKHNVNVGASSKQIVQITFEVLSMEEVQLISNNLLSLNQCYFCCI